MSEYLVRSVVRGLDVLIAVADLGRAASNAELSALVRLHPTTTLRMLESLASRQLLRQLPDGTYDLGTRTLDIGNAFLRRISISRYANEIAQMLSEQVEETASTSACSTRRMCSTSRSPMDRPISESSRCPLDGIRYIARRSARP